jgi:hypothetical protein
MKKESWELTSKERKEIFDRSERIFNAFDAIGNPGNKIGKESNAVQETIYQVAEKEYNDLLAKMEGREAEYYIWDFLNSVCYSAFAIGYIFGQMFDLPYPDLLKDVEALKNKMKEKNCFAYLPREREKVA